MEEGCPQRRRAWSSADVSYLVSSLTLSSLENLVSPVILDMKSLRDPIDNIQWLAADGSLFGMER